MPRTTNMKTKSQIIGGLVLVWLFATGTIGFSQKSVSLQSSTLTAVDETPIAVEPLSLEPTDLHLLKTLDEAELAAFVSALDVTPMLPTTPCQPRKSGPEHIIPCNILNGHHCRVTSSTRTSGRCRISFY